MGQYVHCLCCALGEGNQVTFVGPTHFAYSPDGFDWVKISTGNARLQSARRLLNPFAGAKMWHDVFSCQPDIVHILAGEAYPWSIIGVPYLRKRGIPFVVSIHDAEAHSKDVFGALAQRIRVPVVRAATGIHVHTEEAKRLIGAQNPNQRRICVIPHGSFGPLYTRYKDSAIAREKAVLFFGRIEHYKGVDILLHAKRMLDPSWKLILAGPGKLEGRVRELIAATPNIEVHNRYLSDTEVAHLFQRATVCALPYRDATQSSVPLISAAFGVPVVATAVGGFREDVPRVNGILVRREDPKALAEAIEESSKLSAYYPYGLEFTALSKQFVGLYSSCLPVGLR